MTADEVNRFIQQAFGESGKTSKSTLQLIDIALCVRGCNEINQTVAVLVRF
jgi:hypothetical protein